MSFDYFYGQQSDLFTFYRVPKVLFTNERFWNISADAKMLYGILLDRMSLSVKNGWLDEQNRVFIIFSIEDGKLMGLPLNRALRDENGEMYDAVAGTFLVVGLGEEDFVSLSPELAQKYEEHFHQPEAFLPLGRRLMVIPVPDESVQSDAEKAVNKPPVEHDR